MGSIKVYTLLTATILQFSSLRLNKELSWLYDSRPHLIILKSNSQRFPTFTAQSSGTLESLKKGEEGSGEKHCILCQETEKLFPSSIGFPYR
jgi:hypothetical protein